MICDIEGSAALGRPYLIAGMGYGTTGIYLYYSTYLWWTH